jgi:hypothetical protein
VRVAAGRERPALTFPRRDQTQSESAADDPGMTGEGGDMAYDLREVYRVPEVHARLLAAAHSPTPSELSEQEEQAGGARPATVPGTAVRSINRHGSWDHAPRAVAESAAGGPTASGGGGGQLSSARTSPLSRPGGMFAPSGLQPAPLRGSSGGGGGGRGARRRRVARRRGMERRPTTAGSVLSTLHTAAMSHDHPHAQAVLAGDRGGDAVAAAAAAVSRSCACIGSPCLRHCVHGAPIGGGAAHHLDDHDDGLGGAMA